MPEKYYVRWRGRVQGPFTMAQLQTLRARRLLSRAHQLSTDRRHWMPAGQFAELFSPAQPPAPEPAAAASAAAAPAAEQLAPGAAPAGERPDCPELGVPAMTPLRPSGGLGRDPRERSWRAGSSVAHQRLQGVALLGAIAYGLGSGLTAILLAPAAPEADWVPALQRIGVLNVLFGVAIAILLLVAQPPARWSVAVVICGTSLLLTPLLISLAIPMVAEPIWQSTARAALWFALLALLLALVVQIGLWTGIGLLWIAPAHEASRLLTGISGCVGLALGVLALALSELARAVPVAAASAGPALELVLYLIVLLLAALCLSPRAAAALRAPLTVLAAIATAVSILGGAVDTQSLEGSRALSWAILLAGLGWNVTACVALIGWIHWRLVAAVPPARRALPPAG
ncbi:MAG: hypothetical protein KatS3mg102_0279 [Planctomycetota bacterium]|nr:MAG: hypothetical protein KatS3mg102_0279 [Planctomycetota bacterium]